MNKRSAKSILSIAAVIAVMSSAAASVYAADYAVKPDYPVPVIPVVPSVTVPVTGSDGGIIVSSTKVSVDAINAALDSSDPVVYVKSRKAIIKKDAVAAIANSDKSVTFKASNCEVTIDPDSITKVQNIKLGMNLSLKNHAIEVVPEMKGSFGMTLEVKVPATRVKRLNKDKLKLYIVDDNGSVVEDITSALTVNDDGSVTIALNCGGIFVITDRIM